MKNENFKKQLNEIDSERKDIIKEQLAKMYRPCEKVNIEATLEVLEEVPTARLEWVCLEARKKNTTVSPPSDGKILEVWRNTLSQKSGVGWEKTVIDAMDRRTKNRQFILNNGPYKVCSPGGNPRVVAGWELLEDADRCVSMAGVLSGEIQ